MIEDYSEKYGRRYVPLVDRRATMKVFTFDQALLMPTPDSYRDLVEQARIEISPKIMRYLSKRWSRSTIENLSFFVMAVAVFSRSVLDPPVHIDVGKVLLKTLTICNRRCTGRQETGGGCRLAANRDHHHLPKCIKLPKDIEEGWGYVKRYIATGGAICSNKALGLNDTVGVKVSLASDFSPSASC